VIWSNSLVEKKKLHKFNCFDARLSILPCCLLVIMVGVPFDTALITSIAMWKSPYMLLRGWKRLLEDLIGRKGPFLETECVPFAALAIILWPLAVVGAVLAATLCSPFLALYSGVVVHQVRAHDALISLSICASFSRFHWVKILFTSRKTQWRWGLPTLCLWFHFLMNMWMIYSTWERDPACPGAIKFSLMQWHIAVVKSALDNVQWSLILISPCDSQANIPKKQEAFRPWKSSCWFQRQEGWFTKFKTHLATIQKSEMENSAI